ncbi:CoA transferase [Paraburkholderia dipogonis]|uniref:CoA transferase n=1 Tax=Paraburkholderia dipogonis TaxID=1211383 RepID=A0A4Y8MK70_9BURK|nr:CaiB/BaiF CoA-transferase family protein [Paraburkholderia dipogonis]TFE37814.1 CoA transferase [Paraburkholderia dipogonis]
MDKKRNAPLAGVKVVELTAMITGPLAGTLLADLGAEVIKIENPNEGDPFRAFRGGNYSPYFCTYNRNKKGVTLNLKGDLGRGALLKLLEGADILIVNFRSGVMERLGFGTDKLRQINPRLIICSITGFGESGPYASRPAYDAVGQALSGISSLFLGADAQITGPSIADNLTGMYASYGILGALFDRTRTGEGRTIQINMLESTVAFISDPFANYSMAGVKPDPLMRVRASQSYALRCSDGSLLAVHMSSPQKFWLGLLSALERHDLASDPRFSERSSRLENYEELAIELNKTSRTRSRDYWISRLVEFDVPHAPVLTLPEVIEDAQIRHLETFVEVEHPVHGKQTMIRRPVLFDGDRVDQPLNPAPDLGEHSREVLADLGYTNETIDLIQQGK